ncbi:metallophosphoesterase [Paenibacillus aurantius]|uniref:Metallophosphoesterase n=1 Tax=Paenibacillus aurantius TaxID=2918900 RepID=A0AA96RDJ6_9BACL|nr:metallophosphoesterase [Paenibacillus aurantius]WNQ11455.1 metallophosphoesterase [Paenibacillus aurantius]
MALATVFSLLQPMAALAAGTDSGTIAPKIWLTEIYPNDIARNASYTGLSGATIDSMDYIEVYNASDSEMDFGADYNLVYTDSGDKILTYNEAELKIPAKTPAVFWIRRVDLEGKGKTMPDEAAFRASLGIPDGVPVFSVNNQTALKNSTAKVTIVSKSSHAIVSTYTYTTDDVGSAEGTSVHLQAVEGQSACLPLGTQAPASAGKVSEEQKTVKPQTVKPKPAVTPGTVSRTGNSTASVTFTTYAADAYYYEVVADGAPAPAIDTVNGVGHAVGANGEVTLALTTLSEEAQDLYLVGKNSSNLVSDPLKIDIPAYTASASQGLYLTEIMPNDLPRHDQYTGISSAGVDSMDYIEIYNASDSAVNFGAAYNLVYTDLSVSPAKDVTFAYNEAELKIPAKTPAVFWVRRVDLEGKGGTMPDEADFRRSFGVPDNVPVFSVNNQVALKNTTAKVAIVPKGSSEPVSYYSYASGDAGTVEGASVQLQAAEGQSRALAIAKKAPPSAGQVSEEQKTILADPGITPVLTPLFETGQYDTIREGTDLSIPYSYVDPTGVKSFVVYYRTNQSGEWTAQEGNSFNKRVPGKFYVEIGADRFLNSGYIEYYLEAKNMFRTAVTPVHRVTVLHGDDFSGLRSNLADGQTVSGRVYVIGRSSDNAAVDIRLDGALVDTTRRLEQGAYFTLDIEGLDGAKNAITANGNLVQVFSRWYDVLPSRAVMIDNRLFAYKANGDAEVSVRIVAGTEIDALDTTPGTDSDSFSVTNFSLVLADGTVIQPDGAVKASNTVTLGSSKREVELHFTVPYASLNANGTVWDTRQVEDGSHHVTISTGTGSQTISVNVDNTGPVISAEIPEQIDGEYTFQPRYTDASNVAEDTLMLKLDGKLLSGTSFNGSELNQGPHTLTASVQDTWGNTGTMTWTFSSSRNYPVISHVSSSDVGTDSATLSAVLSKGKDAEVSFHEAQALTVGEGITVYQGSGDGTANAQAGSLGAVTSGNGSLPYQMYAFDVNAADTSLRVSLEAATDYGKDVRLYARSSAGDRWIPLQADYADGKISAVFETGDYLADGKVYVLVQGRGIEMLPSTKAGHASTVANDYVWDGSGEPAQYDFSIAWETDTQYYAQSYPENFRLLNDHIAANKDRMDIRYVVHTGDLIDDIDETYQWERADQYMKILEDAQLPYGVVAGNHDIANHNGKYVNYQKYFGEDRFKDNGVFGGSFQNNLGHYDLVTAGGQDLIFVYMSYNFDREAVAWVNKVLAEYPDRMAVLAFHNYVKANADLDEAGLYYQNEVVAKNPNVKLVLSGHYTGAAFNVEGFDDDGDGVKERKVYQILQDYQGGEQGGNAYYKTLYFDLANGKLYMNSYSPKLNDYNYFDKPKASSYEIGTKEGDQDIYELSLDFNTAPKTLTVTAVEAVLYHNTALGRAAAEHSTASVTVDNLAPGEHTWMAIAANSAGRGYSRLSSFTTKKADASDASAPALTVRTVSRNGDSTATVRFAADEAGTYYYEFVNDGAGEPVIDTNGRGTAYEAHRAVAVSLANLTPGAKAMYLVVKDTAGNVSPALRIDIPAYSNPSGGHRSGNNGGTNRGKPEGSLGRT